MRPVAARLSRIAAGAGKRLGGLWRDRRGVGAVEFALLAPVLLMLYICAFELTVGLSVAKRATRATGTIADLVAQQNGKVTKAFLATMVDVADSIFVPFSSSNLTLKISGITIDASNAAKISWSWQKGGTRPYVVGASVIVPSEMQKPSTFLVRAELSVPHDLMMFMANAFSMSTTQITIKREYFFRQRVGDSISCTDC